MRGGPWLGIFLGGWIGTANLSSEESPVGSNHTVTVNGSRVDVVPGVARKVTLPDGTEVELLLEEKAEFSQALRRGSFRHPRQATVSQRDLGGGVFQTTVATPQGSAILVQEFTGQDPSFLVDLLLEELSAPEMAAGFERSRESWVVRAAGVEWRGIKLVTRKAGVEWIRVAVTHEAGGAGWLVLTAREKSAAGDEAIFERFWSSLRLRSDPVAVDRSSGGN